MRIQNDICDLPNTEEGNDTIREALETAKPVTPEPVPATTEERKDGPPPGIPDDLIERLPSPLSSGARHIDGVNERDVFLTAALPVIAGALPNVRVRHRDGLEGIGIYTATFAPAGSGKGALKYAYRLGKEIDNQLYSQSVADAHRYKEEGEEGEPPLSPSFYLASNTSARAVVDRLAANGERGVICDSELLTAILTGQQDWGQYRDVLLKAAHGEPIMIDRAKGERVRISSPSLSVAVTGTLSALPRFFPSMEDGLFSRFSFLTFEDSTQWRSQRPTEEGARCSEVLDILAVELHTLYRCLAERDAPLIVELTSGAWDRHDAHFSNLLPIGPDPFAASVRRAGLTAVRVSAILAVLRAFEEGRVDVGKVDRLTVEERDSDAANELVTVWLNHARYLSRSLPGTQPPAQRGMTEEKSRFRDELAKLGEFGPREAFETATRLGIEASERSIEKWIGGGIPGIIRTRRGVYRVTGSPGQD